MSAPDAPPPVLSPNSVLANALLRSIDMIRRDHSPPAS